MCAAVPGVSTNQMSEWKNLGILHSDFLGCMVLELFSHIRISGSKLILTNSKYFDLCNKESRALEL